MNIRCKSCHGTIWVHTDDKSRSAEAACKGCDQKYELTAWRELRAAGERLSGDAREFARGHGIDLPGAYSVLLGIMPLSEVQEIAGTGWKSHQPAEDHEDHGGHAGHDERPESAGKQRFDPAFQAAVDKGLMTPRQARERGRREVYATKVSGSHDLPLKLAYAVADNRMSLLEALRHAENAGKGTVQVKLPRRTALPPIWVAGILLPLALAGAVALWPESTEPVTERYGTSVGEVTILSDGAGRIVEIGGPNPRSVLRAFCRVGDPAQTLEELAVVPASERLGRARLGLFRSPDDPNRVLSIVIVEDREGNRWVAGDGSTVLAARPAPEGAQQKLRNR